jgi:Zn-dependent protease with chaperone function
VLESIDQSLLQPTALPPAEQERIRRAFAQMVQTAHPGDAPPWKLEFRRGRDKKLGPNALALPGGTIVLTDELVKLIPGNDDAVLGVLGHEFGHVRQRHAMRQLVQVSAVGFAVSVAFGDYGTLISSAPVLLATLGYSRDAEREADAESVQLMRAVGISPRAMVTFFEAIERWRAEQKRDGREDDAIGLAFSSHPATTERIAFFRDAAEN